MIGLLWLHWLIELPFSVHEIFFIWSFQEKELCSSEVQKAEGIDHFLNQQLYLFVCVCAYLIHRTYVSYDFTQIFPFLADNQGLVFYNTRLQSAKTNWFRQLSQKYLAKITSKVLHCLTLQYCLWSVYPEKYLLLTIPDRCFTKDMWRCVEEEINILQ